MKKQRALQIAAIAMAMTLASPFAAIAGEAGDLPAQPEQTVSSYSARGQSSVHYDKYIVMDNDVEVPNYSVTYTIKAGTAASLGNGVKIFRPDSSSGVSGDVKIGVDGQEAVKSSNLTGSDLATATVTFRPGDATMAEAEAGDKTIKFGTPDNKDDEKFAAHTLNIDFSEVTFTQPGIYRYVISENDSLTPTMKMDEKDRMIDVYVIDDNGTLKINSSVIHTNSSASVLENAKDGEKLADKSTGSSNRYESYDLTFRKEVTGNMGSKDKYFKFTVTADSGSVQIDDQFLLDMTSADPGPRQTSSTVYTEDVMKEANGANANDNGESYVTGAELLKGKDFYLKDGQEITIKGLNKSFGYDVSENAEDYQSTAGITDAVSGAGDYSDVTHAVLNEDAKVGYTNSLTGTIPTGVMVKVLPFVMIALGGIAGVGSVALHDKRRKAQN